MEKMFHKISTLTYIFVSILLTILATVIIGFSIYELFFIQPFGHAHFILSILEAIGAIIISVAIIDVAKYMIEEEVFKEDKELRKPKEARETLTKIIVIISIAVAAEGLVYIFKAGIEDIRLLIYPVCLIFSSTIMVVGLGIYQKFSAEVEEKHFNSNKENS